MEAQRLNLRVKFIYMEILGNKIFYEERVIIRMESARELIVKGKVEDDSHRLRQYCQVSVY